MSEKLFLGIDGGGTKTGFSLINLKGEALAVSVKTTIHIRQVSQEDFRKILNDGIDEVLNKLGKTRQDLTYVFAGVPGYGEYKDMIETIHDSFRIVLGHDRFKIGNDCVAGWAGSQACRPGVNMVLGTGAIAFGRNYEGDEARSSGWGPFCGDEGSAYWMGRKAIEIFAKESDGRLERGAIYNLIHKDFKMESDFDFISIVSIEMGEDRTKIASLAPYITKAAEMGDENALKVFDEAAYEVAIAVKSVIRQLKFKDFEKITITYSGGVFKAGTLLTDRIYELLKEDNRIEVIDSIMEPQEGAALMAYVLSEGEAPESVINRLKG
ncbi:MAG: BadF/BadG/BcrA/BcrD ATPase family protein [Tissierellia bacterium]|nr:BadF/BadG/BcrA/BcrD ATPase family protein [Tissierellia bacterium]